MSTSNQTNNLIYKITKIGAKKTINLLQFNQTLN